MINCYWKDPNSGIEYHINNEGIQEEERGGGEEEDSSEDWTKQTNLYGTKRHNPFLFRHKTEMCIQEGILVERGVIQPSHHLRILHIFKTCVPLGSIMQDNSILPASDLNVTQMILVNFVSHIHASVNSQWMNHIRECFEETPTMQILYLLIFR